VGQVHPLPDTRLVQWVSWVETLFRLLRGAFRPVNAPRLRPYFLPPPFPGDGAGVGSGVGSGVGVGVVVPSGTEKLTDT
jgi:hypothetical protein